MGIKISVPKKGLKIDISSIKLYLKKLQSSISKITTIIGFVLLCISLYYIVFDLSRNANALETEATVLEINFNGKNYVADISYTVNDIEYEKMITIEAESMTVHDNLKIKYNKNNPNDLILTNHIKKIIIYLPISIAILLFNYIKYQKEKNYNSRIFYLKQNGTLIYADIEGIFVNSNAKKKKGKLPYHIKSKYINPTDNQEYTFISEDHYEDLLLLASSKTITKVPVYINPQKNNDYYVDLVYILPEEEKNEKKQ